MRIIIETIPRDKMRYDTLGDWFFRGDELVIQVADKPAPSDQYVGHYEPFLIALHELVEVRLCQARGITQEAVDAFDLSFTGDGEPGDDPAAPYRHEHRFAMIVEHMMAHEMGIVGYGSIE